MKKLLLVFLLLVISVTSYAEEYYLVKRVIDGDTILLSSGDKVRLIGVDTPETVHPKKPVEFYGKEASAFTRRMCEGKPVRLEYDWQIQDRYGRTLAYVYLKDGTFLNAEIVRQGYGHAYTRFPFRYLDDFRSYERRAREKELGLWGKQRQVQTKRNWWGELVTRFLFATKVAAIVAGIALLVMLINIIQAFRGK